MGREPRERDDVVLVDTSVWILVLRRKDPLILTDHVAIDEVVTCPSVIQEVLQGFREEGPFQRVRAALLAMPCLTDPLPVRTFLQAADLYRSARRAGLTVRSPADCLIAACAMGSGASILHHDRDFDALARIAPLDVHSIA